MVFRLDGKRVPLPRPLPPLEVAPLAPAQAPGVTPAMLAQGKALFLANCAICHSNQPRSISPDLRRMPNEVHAAFDEIVLRGALLPGGMPRWDDLLSEADAHAIHAYLIDLQANTRTREIELKREGKPLDTHAPLVMSSY
jgi:quinohemoprotein ethanol dehydrogenase